MYESIKTSLLAAVAVLGSAAPAAGVEELAAPLNAIPDPPAASEALPSEALPSEGLPSEGLPSGIELLPSDQWAIEDAPSVEDVPTSPYDAVPFELDPAIRYKHYSRMLAVPEATPAAPQWEIESATAESATAEYAGAEYVGAEYAAADTAWPAPAWPTLRWPFAIGPAASDACCVAPKIRYWNHPLLASHVCPCGCLETMETHLPVPCQCCPVTIKACVPVCCSGPPQCETGRDLLGRKIYNYCWPNGYRVTVVDRHTGTLMVHTFNR